MKFIEKYNINNKKNRIISVLSILSILIFLINIMLPTTVHADDTTDKSIATSSNDLKPRIDVKYLGINPVEPLVGQGIEVSYQITPHPFQHNISKPKEIVLVLDGSGSMEGDKLKQLKEAAKKFIDKLKDIENLKIGIVIYSSDGTINPISVGGNRGIKHVDGSIRTVPDYKSLESEYLLDVKDKRLYTMIDKIKALGGTNTGEGIRKGEYLLQQGQDNANKTLVLMSDGLPTYYSVLSNKDRSYYTNIDRSDPIIDGTGKDDSNINKSTEYATTIGNIVKNKGYNIFSVGYGLGSANSKGNKKMQEIHKSMGGVVNIENPDDVNNTFFAGDEKAIDSIFNKIADKLEQFYNFNDANLSINLGDAFIAGEGIEIVNNSSIIKVPPIVYELTKIDGVHWYKADPITIKFKVKANKSGEYPIFGSGSKLEYTDINGDKVSIDIEGGKITVKDFTPGDKEKLQVNFFPEKNGYLIGDTAEVVVGFTHPGTTGITFKEAKFDIKNGVSNSIELIDGKTELMFGEVEENTPVQKYKFNIKSNIPDKPEDLLVGNYSYKVKKNNSTEVLIQDVKNTKINTKKGQVIVDINDTNGNPIKGNPKVQLKNGDLDIKPSEIKDGVVTFDNVPTGNYNLKLTEIPEVYEYTNGGDAIVMVNYDNNIAKHSFVLKGKESDGKVTIAASDSSGKVNDIYNSEEGKETRYDKFIKNEFDNEYKLFGQSYADIKFSGEKLNYLQYQILKSDSNLTTMPSDGWSEITAEDDGVNDDIDISEAGKLTQKAYSVFHMKELNSEGYNRDDWKKRELVYKYPFDGVRYVDASVAERKEDYTKKREIINPVTNLPEEIWEPQKVFTKTFDYTGENYKEASKTWGYFKAPESGFYNFGTHSDDGIRFTITNDDGTNLLIDNFEPHKPTFDIATKYVKLEKDKYYPVFIEYFNVGGAAEYGVKYAISDKENMTHPYESYKYVDPGSFFPSKSTAPGESSDGSFEGEGKIMFPEEEGKYYVAYRGFNKDDKNEELVKEGFYGPFIVEDRFTLERIVENNSANSANDFRVKYKIIPKDIRVTDVYKTKEELKEGNVKESLEIKNMYLKDTIPDGIIVNNIYVETEDVKITTNIDEKNSTIDVRFGVNEGETAVDPIGIKYGLNREPNEVIEKAIYKSNPIIVTLDISAKSAKEYVFENKKGKLLYNDISLKDEKIMKESYFAETRFEFRESGSIGIKHINYTPNEPSVGDVIDVNYEIVASPFKAITKAKTDEVVLVLDASSSMTGSKIEKLKLDAKEFIQKFRTLNNNPKPGSIIADNTKMSIVVYSDTANINPASGEGVSKTEILLDKYDKNLERIIDEIKILPSSGENSGEALRKAEYVLTHPDRSDKSANKTIIMMSDGLATNYSVDNNDKYYTEINNENPKIKGTGIESDENIAKSTEYAKVMGNIIKEKGYSVYTIGHGLDDSKINGNMKDIHYSMGGLNSTLFSSDDNAVDKILEKMQYADYQRQSYTFKDVELKVTSGDGFIEVDGFGASDNKSHIIKIPEIKYVLNETTKQYESAPIPMKFKIKADKPGTYPVFNPTSKNRLEYTDFDGQRVSMQVPNPEITVTDNIYEGIKHGLYEGVSGNNISIIENDSTVIAGGTNVNFGATFVSKSNVPKITLTVDKAIESKEIKNMKVYKMNGSKLEEIKYAKITPTTHKNIYDIVLPAEIPKDTTILIRYSAKLPISKNVSYTNNIKVGVSEKAIKVTTTNVEEKDRLPDLF